MSVNKYRDHILILPEDDANRQLANGFLLEVNNRNIQVLPEAGGWQSVCALFVTDHVKAMRNYELRRVVLLLDFDGDDSRAEKVNRKIPDDLKDRVFLLGARTEPERLKGAFGSYETIGRRLATECRSESYDAWNHDLLIQNTGERVRLRAAVGGFIF